MKVLVSRGSWVAVIVKTLGALGVQATVCAPDADWAAVYAAASHVLLTGGCDVHPQHYGERVTWAGTTNAERDTMELSLARWALAEGKPVLGICRGHQVLAVASGGTLHQDIGMDVGVAHCRQLHGVRVLSGSRLARWIGAGRHAVNSYHHQAVKRVGDGWRVVAESLDGAVVEAAEHVTLPAMGVQWHPEVLETQAAGRVFVEFLGLGR